MITVVQIHTWTKEGQTRLSKKEARRLLGIERRDRFNEHCKALELFEKQAYSLEDLGEILGLDLFLRACYGKHSRAQYIRLKKQPKLLALRFQQLGISVENELRRILNDHSTTAI